MKEVGALLPSFSDFGLLDPRDADLHHMCLLVHKRRLIMSGDALDDNFRRLHLHEQVRHRTPTPVLHGGRTPGWDVGPGGVSRGRGTPPERVRRVGPDKGQVYGPGETTPVTRQLSISAPSDHYDS